MEDLGVDGKTIIKCMFKMWDGWKWKIMFQDRNRCGGAEKAVSTKCRGHLSFPRSFMIHVCMPVCTFVCYSIL